MEINHWARLVSAKLVKKEIENPVSDLIIIGHYGGFSTYKQDGWYGYAMKITDLINQFHFTAIQGAVGPRGPQGIQGISGAQGLKGEKGDPGDTFTLLGVLSDPSSLPVDPGNLDAYLMSAGDVLIYDPAGSGPPVPGHPGWINLGIVAGPQGQQGIQGIQGVQGEIGPQGAQGDAGVGIASVSYNSTTGELTLFFTEGDPYTTPSIKGGKGDQGDPGSIWRNGAGIPSNTLGVDGDYYLEDVSGDVYKKENGGYLYTANIKGPAGTGTGGVYNLTSPTSASIAGSGFSAPGVDITGWTWQEIIEKLLCPYQVPSINLFYMTDSSNVTQAGTLEVGASISGNKKFYITYTNSANVSPNTFKIVNDANTPILGPGAAVPATGTYTPLINISPAVTRTTIGTYSWTGSFTATNNANRTKTYTVNWSFKRYVGASESATLDEAGIEGLIVNTDLTNASAGNYVFPTYSPNKYLYFCFPDVSGFAKPLAFDVVGTFFPLSLANTAPYTNLDAVGNSYAIVSVTNAFGVTIDYRVYRSTNSLAANITVAVS